MPRKISNLAELMKSRRFKECTSHRSYTRDEIQQIEILYNHMILAGMTLENGYYKTFCQLVSYDLSNLIDRFDFLKQNSTRRTKETYLARYGKEEGEKRWDSYREKQKIKNLYETKKEKYGWTLEEFKTFNKSRAVTKDLCVRRHGETAGLQMWENYTDRQRYTNSIEYFHQKYGNDGYQKWLDYNREKAKSSNVEWIMSKYLVTKDEALAILSQRNYRGYTSKSELSFVNLLEDHIGSVFQYTVKTSQFCIWSDELKSPFFYDIADSSKLKIIEYNGDYWHCNPIKYAPDFYHPHSQMTAKDIWIYDYAKIKAATDRGFSVKIIWESEFIKDRVSVLEECVKWWNM